MSLVDVNRSTKAQKNDFYIFVPNDLDL